MAATLFLDARTGAGGSTCAAFRYVDASPSQIGNTFGVSYPGGPSNPERAANRNGLVQFQGELYAFAADGIYKKDDPTSMTGPWTIQIAFTVGVADNAASGLYPVDIAGTTYLVGIWKEAGGYRWVKFDGTTWTQAPTANTFTTADTTQMVDVVVYRNVLHCMWYNKIGFNFSSFAFTFDPGTNAFGTVAVTTSTGAGQCMCIFQDRLFAICFQNYKFHLHEFSGGTWVDLGLIRDAYTAAFTPTSGKPCLFTDGINMYAAYMYVGGVGDAGWRLEQFDSALNPSDRTADLPAGLRGTNNGGTFASSAAITITTRMFAIYDVDSVPGTLSVALAFAANSTVGTFFTFYQWNGSGLVMTPVDIGGNVYHSPASGYPSNGERIWTAGELDIKITARAAVLGGEQISFIAYGGGTLRKMKLFYALLSEPNLVEATLAGPVTGGSATLNTGLNQVEGIAADGATVYTVVWDVQADSLAAGQRARRIPQVIA